MHTSYNSKNTYIPPNFQMKRERFICSLTGIDTIIILTLLAVLRFILRNIHNISDCKTWRNILIIILFYYRYEPGTTIWQCNSCFILLYNSLITLMT